MKTAPEESQFVEAHELFDAINEFLNTIPGRELKAVVEG
jgi:hypothetical protein